MNCPYCSKEILTDYSFCGYCGNPTNLERLKSKSQVTLDANIDQIEKEVQIIQHQALDEIKDKAIYWAKRVLMLYGVSLTILFAAFSLFGYKGMEDIKKTSAELEEGLIENKRKLELVEKSVKSQVEELLQKLENQISKANVELNKLSSQMGSLKSGIQDEHSKLNKLNVEIEKLNFQDLSAKINAYKEDLDHKINDVEDLNTELVKRIEDVKLIGKHVSRLKHSLFEIAIHFEIKETKDEEDIKWLVKKLSDEGFFIDNTKVSRISVNQSEIIYYHISAKDVAEFIVKILEKENRFSNITSRFLDLKEINPKAILIKIDPHR